MIKVVSFDIGGTLLTMDEKENNNYNLKSLANLVDMPYEIVRDAYKDIFQKTKGTFEELVNAFCQKLIISINDDLIAFLKNKFKPDKSYIKEPNLQLLKELKNRGYKVILFSNSCCLIENTVSSEVKDYVDDIFYSYDLGYTKDESISYKIIEQKLGCEPNEFLHIGDTLKSDYIKPIENGWNALFYGDTDDKFIKSITNLADVLVYLDNKLNISR